MSVKKRILEVGEAIVKAVIFMFFLLVSLFVGAVAMIGVSAAAIDAISKRKRRNKWYEEYECEDDDDEEEPDFEDDVEDW